MANSTIRSGIGQGMIAIPKYVASYGGTKPMPFERIIPAQSIFCGICLQPGEFVRFDKPKSGVAAYGVICKGEAY